MRIVADMHTHTVACDHAFSTLAENARIAKSRGHIAIAMTEHACAMMGAPTPIYFFATKPRFAEGVRVLNGAEANILGPDKGKDKSQFGDVSQWRKFGGNGFDLPDMLLKRLEYVIASMHEPCYSPENADEVTSVWLEVLDNPNIDSLGHMGNGTYFCDYRSVVKKAADKGVLIEINNHSFDVRKGSSENCETIAKLCMEYGAKIVVSSDAHYMDEVGDFPHSIGLLERIGFPEELVVNADETRLRKFFTDKGVEI